MHLLHLFSGWHNSRGGVLLVEDDPAVRRRHLNRPQVGILQFCFVGRYCWLYVEVGHALPRKGFPKLAEVTLEIEAFVEAVEDSSAMDVCQPTEIVLLASLKFSLLRSLENKGLLIFSPVLIEELDWKYKHPNIILGLGLLFIRMHILQQFFGRGPSWLSQPFKEFSPLFNDVHIKPLQELLNCSDVRLDSLSFSVDCLFYYNDFLIPIPKFNGILLKELNYRRGANLF